MTGMPTPDHGAQLPQQPAQPHPYQQSQQPGYAYPYAQQVHEPLHQYAPGNPYGPGTPTPTVVPAEQLAPVQPPAPGEQRYYAPVAAPRDQRRTTLAAVIVFISLLVALWGILGFLGSMSKTLVSVQAGSLRVKQQLTTANAGLADLDRKTSNVNSLAADSTTLKRQLAELDGGMGSMLAGVDSIATSMQAMDGSLGTLDSELGKLNAANVEVGKELGSINRGLGGQQTAVAGMAKDVKGTGQVLSGMPPRLAAINARMAHMNSVVNFMGCRGIRQDLKVKVSAFGINNGSAQIVATIVPPGAWGTNQDGSTCQR